MERCAGCKRRLTKDEILLGWPVPRLEDGKYICPACYGDEAYCACGEVLSATADASSCAACDAVHA